jgi:hypothetical protein
VYDSERRALVVFIIVVTLILLSFMQFSIEPNGLDPCDKEPPVGCHVKQP